MKTPIHHRALASLWCACALSASAVTLPWTETFSSAGSFAAFTVIDANNDGKTWEYNSTNSYLRISYNSDIDMDDWLITPEFSLREGEVCLFQLDAASTFGAEAFEVFAGTAATVEAMTLEVIPRTVVRNSAMTTFSGEFTAPADGSYRIGIHGCSPADQLYLNIDNLQIKMGVSPSSPEAVRNLTLTPDPEGLDKVTVAGILPALNAGGETLGSIDMLEILCDNAPAGSVTEGLTPGEPFTFVHENAPLGRHTYTVAAYCGNFRGRETKAEVFTGPDVPSTVRNPKIGEFTPGQVTLQWEAPEKDVNGKPLNPALVTYKVVTFSIMENSLFVEEDIPEAEALSATTFTHTAVSPGQGQAFTAYGVYAITPAGRSARVTTPLFPVGESYEAPFAESFDQGKAWSLFRSETIRNYQTVPVWAPFADSTSDIRSRDGGNGFLAMIGEHDDDCARFYSGKISLAGLTRPNLSLYLYNFSTGSDSRDLDMLEIYVSDGTGFTLRKELTIGELPYKGWNRVHVDLQEYAGRTVQIAMQGTVKTHMLIPVDCIAVEELADCSVEAVAVTLPDGVTAGRPFELTVSVENKGALPVAGYTVNLYRNGEFLTSATGPETAPCSIAEIPFTDIIGVMQPYDVVYTAEVTASGDADLSDNITPEASMTASAPRHPSPCALTGKQNPDGSLTLSWQGPDFSSAAPDPVTDDFENYESFSTGTAGEWIFTDNDGKQVGKLDLVIPNVTFEGSVQSFWVMDATLQGANALYAARSGNRYLAQIFNHDNSACDDWAISPPLYEGGQTIGFHAKSYSSYPTLAEQFELLYSTGSTDISDFILLESVTGVPNAWTCYEFTLPEGAARFAIRCTSEGCYMLFVDDVTYLPASGTVALELIGYNIYRDGLRINSEPVSATTFTDTDAPSGTRRYAVSALFDKGESAPSEEFVDGVDGLSSAVAAPTAVRVTASKGEITVTGAYGMHLAVHSADGRTIRTISECGASERIEAAPGIYIVKAGESAWKVSVR